MLKYKLNYPSTSFVHRVDGPISKYRNRNVFLDKLIHLFAQELADGVVFQSQWSMEESEKLGCKNNQHFKVIHNAADPMLFYPDRRPVPIENRRIRLIATSWSANLNKGFDIYRYLDANLNFDEYEFTFIGNSPIKFKNINYIRPLPSSEIANYLRKSHVYVIASELESCSNSIIEALSCGLPVVYRNGSSNPEIVKQAGLPFSNGHEAIEAIGRLRDNYRYYRNAVDVQSAIDVAAKYREFVRSVVEEQKGGRYKSKRIGIAFIMKYNLLILLVRINDRLFALLRRLRGGLLGY